MLLENPYYQRFNDSIVPAAAHYPRVQNQRRSAPGADVRIKRQSRPYWVTELSGLKLNERQKNHLLAIYWRNQNIRPVLMRISIFCEIGDFGGRDALGDPIIIPMQIGVGDGTPKNFQLRTRFLVEGYESEELYFVVKHPEWQYPPMLGIAETIGGPVPWKPMNDVQIYANGVPLAPGAFTVNRDTGMVSTSASGAISATGGFYVPMLLPSDGIPIGQDPEVRHGSYIISDGVRLEEPAGGY